jgi:putative Mg2+ transporter-C (MgtC) family protein
MDIPFDAIEKILLAAALGAVIGFEREYKGKSAGFRTLMLVSVGSALFTLVSHHMAVQDPLNQSDVTRIASNIVTGIGFIGAGLIFKGGVQGVQGLTTAATVWVSAAVGMAVGIDHYILATATTILIVAILYLLNLVEKWVASKLDTRQYKLSWKKEYVDELNYQAIFKDPSYKLNEAKQFKLEDRITVLWTIRATKDAHERVIKSLSADQRILELEY